jgi:hypothetical protein
MKAIHTKPTTWGCSMFNVRMRKMGTMIRQSPAACNSTAPHRLSDFWIKNPQTSGKTNAIARNWIIRAANPRKIVPAPDGIVPGVHHPPPDLHKLFLAEHDAVVFLFDWINISMSARITPTPIKPKPISLSSLKMIPARTNVQARPAKGVSLFLFFRVARKRIATMAKVAIDITIKICDVFI